MTSPSPWPADAPHSRACGWQCPGHGVDCHSSCPTCGGKAAPADVGPLDPTVNSPWLSAAWMQTYTGVAFRPWVADVSDIVLEDIAHSLAFQCRYNGHTREFYSVAQHAVLLANYALQEVRLEDAYWALFHDAAEAYIGDMVRPVKVEMPEFRALDDALTATIAVRFGLDGTEIPSYVKALDARILLDERDALLTAPPQPWDVDQLAPLGIQIVSWSPSEAKAQFLGMYDRLEELRAAAADAEENPSAPARGSLARIFYDHDYDRQSCSDHSGRCCPNDNPACHGLAESQHEHYARMVEVAGYGPLEDGEL